MSKQLDLFSPEFAPDYQRAQHEKRRYRTKEPGSRPWQNTGRRVACTLRVSAKCDGTATIYEGEDPATAECIKCWCCDPGDPDYIGETGGSI